MASFFDDINWEKATLRQLKKLRLAIKNEPNSYNPTRQDIILLNQWIKTKQNQFHAKAKVQTAERMLNFLKRIMS